MKLTPLDIRKQEFRKTLRGFDPIEVQTFLEMVAEEYERLLEENKQVNQQLVELRTKLADYQETEKTLRETLLNVQEVKKQSEESSRRQADLIIKEAELKAMEIIENARKQARQMRDEVSMLRTQKESFINRLRQILLSQIELLSVLEIDDAIPEEAQQFIENYRQRKKGNLQKQTRMQKMLEERKSEEKNAKEASDAIELVEEEKGSAVGKEEGAVKTFAEDLEYLDDAIEESQKEAEKDKAKKGKSASPKNMDDDEINEFFKKGIQIDELIKDLDKKQKKQGQ